MTCFKILNEFRNYLIPLKSASMKDIDDNYEAYRYAFVFIIPFDFL